MNSGPAALRLKAGLPRLAASIATLLITLGTAYVTHAQGYVVDAQISGQPAGDGSYNYTINLNNNISSLNPIGTFWFGWVPDYLGYDLLPSFPSNVQTPDGWGYNINYGSGYGYYPDGYSIEFYANDAPLAPGSSLTFAFNSTDSPSDINGTSPFLGIPASTSYVYSGYAFSDGGAEISLTPVPEPSSISLLMAGAAILIWTGRRSLGRQQLAPAKL